MLHIARIEKTEFILLLTLCFHGCSEVFYFSLDKCYLSHELF